MAVLIIKDMEMPESCTKCFMLHSCNLRVPTVGRNKDCPIHPVSVELQTNEDIFRNLPLGELIKYLAVRGCPPPYSDDCPEPRTLCTICWENWFREKGGETK